eukprot:3088604-Amphidinium_carterae.1
METETIPSATRWDNVRSLLLGAYTKQGSWSVEVHRAERTLATSATRTGTNETSSSSLQGQDGIYLHPSEQSRFTGGTPG